MRQPCRSAALVAVCVAACALLPAGVAAAHVRKASGPYRVQLGWADEPAYSGARNAVELEAEDRAGEPVVDARQSLRVEVSFGDARRTLAFVPADEPGRYAAAIVPTRPGRYGFHVTGTLRGRQVDVSATCSERTFECVESAAAIQFPAAEPAGSDLDRKLDRALARAAQADQDADRARTLAIAALAAAALGLVAVAAVALRRTRRG